MKSLSKTKRDNVMLKRNVHFRPKLFGVALKPTQLSDGTTRYHARSHDCGAISVALDFKGGAWSWSVGYGTNLVGVSPREYATWVACANAVESLIGDLIGDFTRFENGGLYS